MVYRSGQVEDFRDKVWCRGYFVGTFSVVRGRRGGKKKRTILRRRLLPHFDLLGIRLDTRFIFNIDTRGM